MSPKKINLNTSRDLVKKLLSPRKLGRLYLILHLLITSDLSKKTGAPENQGHETQKRNQTLPLWVKRAKEKSN
jgi:hypothetical protein